MRVRVKVREKGGKKEKVGGCRRERVGEKMEEREKMDCKVLVMCHY